jgi:hypothetical protein
MKQAIKLAFYYNGGTALDRLIRVATRSTLSHVELVAALGPTHPCTSFTLPAISSSSRDGGVREKHIAFNLDHWVFLEVEGWAPAGAWSRAMEQLGLPYDYAGILMNFTVPLRRHLRDSWFCSELCGHALGLDAPHTLSPGDLHIRVQELNRAYRLGQADRPPD